MATNPLAQRHEPPPWVVRSLTAVVLLFVGAYGLMLGMAHAHTIWPSAPALGYADSLMLMTAAGIVVRCTLFSTHVKVID